MSMLETFEAAKKSVARTRAAYTQARGRESALADLETPAAALLALASRSRLGVARREQILAALVREQQRAPSGAMQSLLLVAFEPMLVQLRAKLGETKDEERDQALYLAFFEALRTVQPGAFTSLGVRWATEARVFADRRSEQRAPETTEHDADVHGGDAFGARADRKMEASELLDVFAEHGGEELAAAVIATEAYGEPLREYVARVHGGCPATYERLARGRAAVVDRLRARAASRDVRAA